ncbi:MAG: diaminopimelate epimerase [Sphingomonadaceae bacterium]|nr:diaminopimelate epimerase [Sphingomonadaceae bacterium]
MRFAFHKMHGLGNDFVVIDARVTPVTVNADEARGIADRHTGIGCDQLIVIEPSDTADARMRVFNADGGEVESCGNAARAVALLLGERSRIETAGGMIDLSPEADGATVDMGSPRFGWDEIPLAYAMDTAAMPVGWGHLETPAAVNVGNPHAIFFVEDCDTIDVARLGPLIEHDLAFPDRVNVNIATVTGPNTLRLRVWERGAGETLACGTGACAAVAIGIRLGLLDAKVEVATHGGALTIEWLGQNAPVLLTGPAETVYEGEIDL